MLKQTTPARRQPGQGLDNDFGDPNSSTNTNKRKGINSLKTLQEIANKWVKMGCYKTPDRALRALIGDQL